MAAAFLTAFSKAKHTAGFDKSPLSFLFSEKHPHHIGAKGDQKYLHEVERNNLLICNITDEHFVKPKLYPQAAHFNKVQAYKAIPYITIAPASVWFTKQFPAAKWVELLKVLPAQYPVYVLGGPADKDLSEAIIKEAGRDHITNLAGRLSFMETAALMRDAVMNYCNDSAPMHFASAMNAAVTAIYCSTIPEFGFGPLSDQSFIVEVQENLSCRSCGLHGHRTCPQGHFKCALDINVNQLTRVLKAKENE
jgi:heptosyltransferase-2